METTREQPVEEMTQEESREGVHKTLKNHVLASMGVGLIPLPLVDFAALTGVQLNLLRKMSHMYGVTFSRDKGKNIIASLLGGVLPVSLAGTMGSLLKAIPIIGQTTGVLAMPIVSGAATYALGKVFIQHFESGGTVLNFDPEAMREHFRQEFEEGKKVAADLKKTAATSKSG